jgi:hypothetical protein
LQDQRRSASADSELPSVIFFPGATTASVLRHRPRAISERMWGALAVLFFFGVAAVTFGATAMLVHIGGTSDGPGALFFYIIAFFGWLILGWAALDRVREAIRATDWYAALAGRLHDLGFGRSDDELRRETLVDRLGYWRAWIWRLLLGLVALHVMLFVLRGLFAYTVS